MIDPARDQLVFLLAEVREQKRKSTKPDVFAEVEKRTKLKLKRMYEKAIEEDRMKRLAVV